MKHSVGCLMSGRKEERERGPRWTWQRCVSLFDGGLEHTKAVMRLLDGDFGEATT
jgi:hypothetical protein